MPGSFSTDLLEISNADTTTTLGTFIRIGGASSANPAAEPDAKIQGVACMAGKPNTVVDADSGTHFNRTATVDLTTFFGTDGVDGQPHLFHWRNVGTAANMWTKASQGWALGITSSSVTATTSPWAPASYWRRWFLDGDDTDRFGGWRCYVVNPAGAGDLNSDPAIGSTQLAAIKNFAFICRQRTSVSTANNIFVDIIRYGTGLTFTLGTSNDPVTLMDILTYDNHIDRAWGILTASAGIFFGAGKIRIGTAAQGAITYFKDVGRVFVWKDYPVKSDFYEFKLVGTASYPTTMQLGNYSGGVASNGCTIRGAGSAIWTLTVGSNGITLIYDSSLSRMKAATLTNASEIRFSVISDSGTIDVNGAAITDNSFLSHTDTQLKVDSATEMAAIKRCKFISGGTCHAIEATAPGDYSLDGHKFLNFGADETANAAFYNNSSGNGIINISCINGSDTPTVKNEAGRTTNFVTTYPIVVNGLITDSRVKITKTSNGDVLFNDVEVGGSINFSTNTYTGEVRIEARKASAPSYYQPWVTIVTVGTGQIVTALQVRDDQ